MENAKPLSSDSLHSVPERKVACRSRSLMMITLMHAFDFTDLGSMMNAMGAYRDSHQKLQRARETGSLGQQIYFFLCRNRAKQADPSKPAGVRLESVDS